jgi:hypothetical protein
LIQWLPGLKLVDITQEEAILCHPPSPLIPHLLGLVL